MRVHRQLLVAVALVPGFAIPARGQVTRVAASQSSELRDWDDRIAQKLREGALTLRKATPDTLIPGRQHERFAQVYRGVPVFGGEMVRQSDGSRTVSVFGTLYDGIDLDPRPTLTPDQAVAIVEKVSGAELGPARVPELTILPKDGGGYALVYRLRAATQADITMYFIDARTGEVVHQFSDLKRQQAAVGLGTGVLGDQKKMSVASFSGAFVASDELRPPALVTFDMKGDLIKTINFLNGDVGLGVNDVARDSDNDWRDGAVVDAHTYAGWTYDYYFKRFGRRGLDNNNIEMLSLVHPVRREDIFFYPASIQGLFYLNAFYAGDGIMVYGEGLPTNLTAGGQQWNFLSGALDVVTHELTHGVTDYTSGLIYQNESGALNESFSDMMAAGSEFYFQAGSGKADYLLGEDVITPGGLRSMQNPAAYGDPDHYSIRFTGSGDNGGVHINSGIPNHVFYLAIEGGRNRVSGLSVEGVGGGNRDQIEKVCYRAFTQMMPASANFSTARAVMIQSARDLFGTGSAAERAVTQAWNAVGVS